MIYLYCLAVQAGFYSDAVECWPVTRTAQVRYPAAAEVIRIFSPVTSMTGVITKIYLYNFDPLKPHFHIVKLGFTGVYIIFLVSVQKHRLWVLVRIASARRF